jgi:hypothetical protein
MTDVKKVRFQYKGKEVVGTVKRLNRKTVTVETKTLIFRVPYPLITPKMKPPAPKPKSPTNKREWTSSQEKDYQKSVKTDIEPLPYERLKSLHVAIKLLRDALKEGNEEAINEISNETISELNLFYNLPPLKVYTGGKRRMTRSGGQYYGEYRTNGKKEKKYSTSVYSRTAKNQKYVAPKTFLRTLIHEWGHHYDKHKLRLKNTYHTKGFYGRIKTIYDQLKEPLEQK